MDNFNGAIPPGCSFTLLVCQFNANSGTQKQRLQRATSNTNFPSNRRVLQHEKMSLKNIRSQQQTARLSNANQQYHNMNISLLSGEQQSFTEISSVIGPRQTKRDQQKNQKNALRRKTSLSRMSPQVIYHYQKNNPANVRLSAQNPKTENFSNLQGQNVTNVFTDQITLNHPSGYYELREKQVQNIKPNFVCEQALDVFNNTHFQRRVHTEQDKQHIRNERQTCKQNRPPALVYRSQFFNNQINERNESGFRKHNTDLPIHNQAPMKTSSTIKKTQFTELKTSQNQIESVMRSSFPTNPTERGSIVINKMSTQVEPRDNFSMVHNNEAYPFALQINQTQNTQHTRKLSSPRFPKKFNTLVDLNFKNVSSSGGEKTSSNHVSIVASQDSQNNSNFASKAGSFSQVLKYMTLKSMPLKETF